MTEPSVHWKIATALTASGCVQPRTDYPKTTYARRRLTPAARNACPLPLAMHVPCPVPCPSQCMSLALSLARNACPCPMSLPSQCMSLPPVPAMHVLAPLAPGARNACPCPCPCPGARNACPCPHVLAPCPCPVLAPERPATDRSNSGLYRRAQRQPHAVRLDCQSRGHSRKCPCPRASSN